MGNVGSKAEDGFPLYLRDQSRFAVTSVKITTGADRELYTIIPNAWPATRYNVQKKGDDDSLIEYIHDPESPSNTPSFLLKLPIEEELNFYFTFLILQSQITSTPNLATDSLQRPVSHNPLDTNIVGLTFTTASTRRELETLLTREFHADPNLHKHSNVDLVGDYSTAGKTQETFEWSWKWRPPKAEKDRGGGWRNSCSFVEYDQRLNKLNVLVGFSYWVYPAIRNLPSPKSSPPRSGRRELTIPTARLRVPSSQSVESRMSDSDTEVEIQPKTAAAPAPPEVISEYSLLEPSVTSNNPIKVDIGFQKPGEDLSSAEDGPVFRATLKAMEQRNTEMRARIKLVLKKAEEARTTQSASNAAISAFMEALRAASKSKASAVQPALDHYFEHIATEILAYEKQNVVNLQKLIIDPVYKIYSNEIKQVDAKRRDFEDESRDYYAYVGRYLGQRTDSLKEKKRAESDTKYQTKRKNFELKRFDYSSFMQDLHGGRKEQEVLYQLTKYADTQAQSYLATAKKVEELMPRLEALSSEVKEVDKEYKLQRAGREEKRRALEKGAGVTSDIESSNVSTLSSSLNGHRMSLTPGEELAGTSYPLDRPKTAVTSSRNIAPPSSYLDPTLSTSPRLVQGQFSASPGSDRFKGYRDLEEQDRSQAGSSVGDIPFRKEGLLWSMSRPTDSLGLKTPTWHKFWVVLDQGMLSEYVNWKQNLEPHLDPIDLRVASVREARNADRRFCFEVITPNYTRVYQGTSEEDMRSWISAINNALQSAFESRQPPPERSASTKGIGSIAKDLFGKGGSFHGHRSTSSAAHNHHASRMVARHATVGDRPPLNRSASSEDQSSRMLQSIRDADPGNALCADCGADSRVEWVSINLGIIICIECSGIHRSLGTHITKIRSLTLDTVSFTQDITEILMQVGNRISNTIWEARLDNAPVPKPGPASTRDQRLRFITTKYSERAFVDPLSSLTSRFHSRDEHLLASIKQNDLHGVLYGLALGANPSIHDRSRNTPAVILALAAADPASPGQTNTISSKESQPSPQPRKNFAIAELLIQNGAELPLATASPFPLSRSAQLYLEFKQEQKQGRTGLGHSNTSAGTSHLSPPKSSGRPVSIPRPQGQPSASGPTMTSGSLPTHMEQGMDDTLTALPSFDGPPGSSSSNSNGWRREAEKLTREKLVKRSSVKGPSSVGLGP